MKAHFIIKKHKELSAYYMQRFQGLGLGSAYLAHILIDYADPETGLVENLSIRDLSLMLAVDHAPGRKNSGIPPKTRVRSYLHTIQLYCPNDFKIISEGQKLKLQFPSLPKIYQEIFAVLEKESLDKKAESDEDKTQQNQGNNSENTGCEEAGKKGEVSTKAFANKNNNYNKTNFNKLKGKDGFERKAAKKSIADDFYPSHETVIKALVLGLERVTNSDEIAAFIAFNQKYDTAWEDFNPVFIRWLEKGRDYEKKQQLKLERKHKRSAADVHHSNARRKAKTPSFDELMRSVREANPDAWDPRDSIESSEALFEFDFNSDDETYGLVVEESNRALRQSVCA